jgi:[ribosomal protein S5]-alanine N-acetyltransferase
MIKNIETKRLILRKFCEADAEVLTKICNQPHILKWMPDWKCTVEERKGWINWIVSRYECINNKEVRVMLGVTLKDDNRLIGMVGVGNKSEVDNEIEIAFFISEEYSNNGYISEAANAMTSWVLNEFEIDYLIAIVEFDNYPSQKVINNCNFEKIGIKSILNSGETEDKPFFYYRLYKNKG